MNPKQWEGPESAGSHFFGLESHQGGVGPHRGSEELLMAFCFSIVPSEQAGKQRPLSSRSPALDLDLREHSGKGLKHTGSTSTDPEHGCGQTGMGTCCTGLKGGSNMSLGISLWQIIVFFLKGRLEVCRLFLAILCSQQKSYLTHGSVWKSRDPAYQFLIEIWRLCFTLREGFHSAVSR